MINLCPNCGFNTEESTYCDNCGKILTQCTYQSEEQDIDNKENFVKTEISLKVLQLKSSLKINSLFQSANSLVENPIHIDEVNNNIYFLENTKEQTLKSFISNKRISYKDIKLIMLRIIDIFIHLEDMGLVVDKINFEDFYVIGNDISTLFLKRRRNFISCINEKKIIDNRYNYGEDIVSPEISSKIELSINYKCNVYVLGKIFVKLLLNEFSLESNEAESYYSYYLNMFRNDVDYRFHDFIYKSTNFFAEERFEDSKEFKSKFIEIISETSNVSKKLSIDCKGLSDVGVNKLKRSLLKKGLTTCENPDDYNEDIYYCNFNKKNSTYVLAVADGVSTASCGTGKIASNIVKDTIEENWLEYKDSIFDEKDVYEFFHKIIFSSNRKITDYALDYIEKTNDNVSLNGVMATTLVIALIIDNTMYYTSIGDSKAFIYNKNYGLNILNYEENYGNRLLLKNYNWISFCNTEEKDTLVNFIGGVKIEKDKIMPRDTSFNIKKINLNSGDAIILCSDGITDYIYPMVYSDIQWKQTNILKNFIEKHIEYGISKLNTEIINEANRNGGGDNLTIVSAYIKD